LLGCGNRTWPDLARARQELALYPGFELMHGACPPRRDGTPGGDEALDRAGLAAGLVVGKTLHRRPADWKRHDKRAGSIRNEAMAAEIAALLKAGVHVEGLALGSLVRSDEPNRASGTGHMVGLLRKFGVRVRWVPAPDAMAQALALRVYSARCGQERDPDDLDITRAHGGPRGAPFAPSWMILNPALEARRRATALRQSDPGQADTIEQEAWAAYVAAFMAEMRQSYRENRTAWRELLARGRVVLRCRCQDPARCHRVLLRERILPALGAVYIGELPVAERRQLTIPGA